KGREEILKVHMRGKEFDSDVNTNILARRTPGLVGADLENLINEAALLTARHNKDKIGMAELEEGIERVMAGPERKSRLINDKEKKIIAYHEIGHAMVARVLPDSDPVHKISIIPRGHAALGYTLQVPEEDRFLMSRSDLLNRITILLSGRTAEELVFGDVTSGAANDLERATRIARQMVTELGMSDKLGLVKLGNKREEIFLGRDISEDRNYSEEVASEIDKEVKAIIDKCYFNAREILSERRTLMDKIVKILLEREVLDGDEFAKLMDGDSDNKPEDASAKPAEPAKVNSASTEPEELKDNLPDLPDVRIDKLPDDKFMA
ncbi:MAG: cell division protein FtsH, partial [Synergistaceae bacterium]|nr:cell division protein FtsH [Synergistaceae bacterium]